MKNQLVEFQNLQFQRDNTYFAMGFASWEVKCKRKTYFVHAIYRDTELFENETTKDYTNGIKGFELQDSKFKPIKQFKVKKRIQQISLQEVEDYIKQIS